MSKNNTKTPKSTKTSRLNKLFLVLLFLIGILVIHHFWINKILRESHLFFWEKNILVPHNGTFFVLHKDNLSKTIINNFTSLGKQQSQINTVHKDRSLFTKEITDKLLRFKNDKLSLLIFNKNYEELAHIPSVSLKSDWWILERTIIPQEFPKPSQGIIFLGTQSPGKSLYKFAEKEQIPVLEAKKSLWWIRRSKNQPQKISQYQYP